MADPQLDALSTYTELIEQARGQGKDAVAEELAMRRDALATQIWGGRPQAPPQEEYRSAPVAPPAPPQPAPVLPPSSMGGARPAPPPAASGEVTGAIPPQATPAPLPAPAPAPPTTPGPRHAPGTTWGDWLLKQYELIKKTDPSYAPGQSVSDIAIAAPLAAAKQIPFAGPWVDEGLAKAGEIAGVGDYASNRAEINRRVEALREANPVATGMIELTGGAAATGAAAPLAQGSAIANTLLGTGGKTLLSSAVKGATSAAAQAANRVFGEGDRSRKIWDQIQDAAKQGGIAGAIGGGVPIALGGVNWLAKRAGDIAKNLPTYDELAAREKSRYTNPEYLGAEANEQAAKRLQDDIRNRINPRITDSRAPQSYGVVDDMLPPSSSPGTPASTNPYTGVYTPATPPAPRTMPIEHLEHQRQALGNIPAGTEEFAKAQARKGVDNFLENLQQSDLAKGNAANVAEILKSGRLASSARQTLDMLGKELEWKPAFTTRATHSSQNADNQLRQAAKKVAFNENETRWMTPAERNQLEVISGKDAVDRNFLRNFSKVFPTSGVGGLAAGGGLPTSLAVLSHFTGGNPILAAAAALPVMAASLGARKMADMGTKKAVEDLTTLVRARGAGVQDKLVEQWRQNEMLSQLFGTTGALAGR